MSEFDFDNTPSAGKTLIDPQPPRDRSGGGAFDDFDDEVADNSPKKVTKCKAVIARPNKWGPKDGNSGVALNFTASEGDIAGFEAALFLTLKGTPSKVQRGKADLAKLCKKLGIEATGTTSSLLDQVADKAGEEVEVTFKPSNNGGCFVNL